MNRRNVLVNADVILTDSYKEKDNNTRIKIRDRKGKTGREAIFTFRVKTSHTSSVASSKKKKYEVTHFQ